MKEWAKSFYLGKAWKHTSKAYMQSKGYICERCGEAAKICHHRVHLTRDNITSLEFALCWDNLEALCQECHNREHKKKKRKRRYGFDEEGNIIQLADESDRRQ